MRTFPARVRVVEIGPRDGLQNEAAIVPAEAKAAFIEQLARAGCAEIEVTSFVRPDRVPQLADAEEVLGLLPALPGTVLSALVPNERGLERALAAGLRRITVFTAASEDFNLRNIGLSIDASLDLIVRVVDAARAAGATARGYVSMAFIAPSEGEVPVERVAAIAGRLFESGVDEISLGDTVGLAAPGDVYERLEFLLPRLPADRVAMHFHDTSGTALANLLAGLEMGVSTFDSSAGGLGGCPFAPGAAGNLATEDLIYMMDRMGIQTGISLDAVFHASAAIEPLLGHSLPGRQFQRLRAARLEAADAR
jgi:isopropylmalate/homocitrate/citramalate synthase